MLQEALEMNRADAHAAAGRCYEELARSREYLPGRHRLGQGGSGSIFLGQQRRHARETFQRPGDPHLRITPAQGALAALAPETADGSAR